MKRRPTSSASRPVVLLGLVVASLLATDALAQIYDARGMGMGSVTLSGRRGEVARVNCAYRDVPIDAHTRGRAYPLPIGLLGPHSDFPTFDPDDEDFDLVAIAEFVWNFPWALRLTAPPEGDDDVVIDVAQDRVAFDLGVARDRVPTEGFDSGGYRSLFSWGVDLRLGERHGSFHVAPVEIWEVDQIQVDLDDDLVGVLRDGDPVVGGRRYDASGGGMAMGGVSSSVTYVREIPLGAGVRATGEDWLDEIWDALDERPRLWAGAALRRYYGIAHVGVEGASALSGVDPLFGDEGAFDLEASGHYVRATPRGLTRLGTGWGLDLGAVLKWRRWEFGAGVADLFAELEWKNATLHRVAYDPVLEDVVEEVLDDRAQVRTEIPTSWRLNTIWRPDPRTVAAFDWGGGPGGNDFHLGGERWLTPRYAARLGFENDRRSRWQMGLGLGLRFDRVGFDLGLRSHSRNLPGDRDWELGLALVLGAGRGPGGQ